MVAYNDIRVQAQRALIDWWMEDLESPATGLATVDAFLKSRGIAKRALHEADGDWTVIPAGINLGGYCMMKLPKHMLFFHRMKLRNNTIFRITELKNDFTKLALNARILLNDLYLFGSYDVTAAKKPGVLDYEPSFGQYRNKNSTVSVQLKEKNIAEFSRRLKADLDKWLKDYFNDYLMHYVAAENKDFENYNREKTQVLNNFADKAIDKVVSRIHEIKANAVRLPSFVIHIAHYKEIRLRDGVLRGLDNIYRRAITTANTEKNCTFWNMDTVVGFSDLKIVYRYDAILKSGPPVTGSLIVTADELTAHMRLTTVIDTGDTDLSFEFFEQGKPESLIVEGPANRMISNFKLILEHHIVAIMSNALMHNINMLSTLSKCVPLLTAYTGPKDLDNNKNIDENDNNIDDDDINSKDMNQEDEELQRSSAQETQPEKILTASNSSELIRQNCAKMKTMRASNADFNIK
ncbi:uncharacterized protein LOC123656574 [Melitaea cinxia]|uniref:uncharacterized protein LOC123656574 n=1 Tax=Melitaea cinxia TaxID=113334 RepID=UPI001E271B73|nr:uncharacterized protein LOC123656574 [Melitaea cinxia]